MSNGTRGGGLSVGDRIHNLEVEVDKLDETIDGVDQYGREERKRVWQKLTELEVEIAKTKTRLAIFLAVVVFAAQMLGGALTGLIIAPAKAQGAGQVEKEAPK